MTRGRIGVLCGGPSAEREISLRSGQAVWRALQERGYDAGLIELHGQECEPPLRAAGIQTAFIALHGTFGEDGQVQTLLESLGIAYTGSGIAASRLAFDKVAAKARLQATGIPVPRGYPVPAGAAAVLDGLGLPLVVKPSRQGSSLGLTIVERADEWPAALDEAGRYDTTLVCEEYLPGAEVTVGIVEDAALPVVQVVPHRRFYDYVAKYTPGMTDYLVPAPLDPATTAQVQTIALRAHRALGCRGFSRVDGIVTLDRGFVVLEVNTIPGLTATSLLPKAAAAAGMPFSQLCERLLASVAQREEGTHDAA